jgi:uncharacterized membrane protein YvbJ
MEENKRLTACEVCGANIATTAQFCPHCGHIPARAEADGNAAPTVKTKRVLPKLTKTGAIVSIVSSSIISLFLCNPSARRRNTVHDWRVPY